MSVNDTIRTITAAISPSRAFDHAAALSRCNRVPLSPGYDEAAAYCVNVLEQEGIECRVTEIPLEMGSRLWTQDGFDSWACRSATLVLDGDEQPLCDYHSCPMSLVQRSAAFSGKNVPIVLLDRGSDMAAYDDLPLEGAIVFIHAAPYGDYLWAIRQRGALGLITDHIPPTFTKDRHTLPDERSFFSFSWTNGERPFFGFVLTPRQGDALRERCRAAGAAYPTCSAEIDTVFSPGLVRVVEALLPGTREDEIVITAHLCHAAPSANDNASGCAGALEIMTALSRLLRQHTLPPLRWGIRMLLVPEVCGTYAYLASHEERIPRMKAAINLDMIGRRQEGRSGMLGIWATPDALPSFIIDLMGYVRSLSNTEAPSFNIDGHVTPFHSCIMEYNGGSDHYVYCDPTVGVPCITFMQWMDRHYHTSGDVAANLDPEMLHKSTSMAACWVYALAAPDLADLPHAFAHMRLRFLRILRDCAERKAVPGISYAAQCAYETAVFQAACDDAARFYGDGAHPLIADQKQALHTLALLESPLCPEENETAGGDTRVPRRCIRGPVSFVGAPLGRDAEREIAALGARFPGLYGYHSINHFILFWTDGRRSVSQIARLVGLEGRYYSEGYVSGYLDILCRCGLITFEP